MLHDHYDAPGPGNQIHCSAHAFDHLSRNHPVGDITLLTDLHRPQNRQIDVAAPNHREAFRAVKDRGSGQSRDRLFTLVDEISILFRLVGKRADTQQSVLALQNHTHAGRYVVGDESWNADAEVDILVVAQLLRSTLRELLARQQAAHRRSTTDVP